MSNPFYRPLKPKKEEAKAEPIPGKNKVWNYSQPHYDNRSSCFINAGTDYGVGHNQPVGHAGAPKQKVPALPTHVITHRADEI